MGIRITKLIGFTIHSELNLNDEELEHLTLKDIYNQATEEEKKKLNFDFYGVDLKSRLLDYIHFIPTEISGLKQNIFSIIPPVALKDWKRYNSTLDYHSFDGIDASLQIKYLHEPVIPYSHNQYIVNSTKKEINSITAERCRFFDFERIEKVSGLSEELTNDGLDVTKNLKDQIHIDPPIFVKLVSKKLNITDDSIFKLALITYWS